MYLIVTFLGGPSADFYPYPFLEPRSRGDYGRPGVYVIAVAVVFFIGGTFIKWWADKRRPVEV
jgi:hypothetical protein